MDSIKETRSPYRSPVLGPRHVSQIHLQQIPAFEPLYPSEVIVEESNTMDGYGVTDSYDTSIPRKRGHKEPKLFRMRKDLAQIIGCNENTGFTSVNSIVRMFIAYCKDQNMVRNDICYFNEELAALFQLRDCNIHNIRPYIVSHVYVHSGAKKEYMRSQLKDLITLQRHIHSIHDEIYEMMDNVADIMESMGEKIDVLMKLV